MSESSLKYSEVQRLACFTYSVGHNFEGVCLVVTMGKYRILLDCGNINVGQFRENGNPPADFVFCSHAHHDHSDNLLELHQAFPAIPIYTSEVTAKLLPLNWLEQDNQPTDSFCQAFPWQTPIQLAEGLSAELFPAGHLPGATAILLRYTTPQRTYKLLYTGDFALSNSRLVEGLSVEEVRGLAPDVLIIEGSYGTARYPRRRKQENLLMEQINQALANHHSVFLPVPSLGLGQEILMLLRSHHQFTGRDLDIWVDGNVALGCDLYLELLPYFPLSVRNFAKHQPLFWDEKVRPRMHRVSKRPIPTSVDSPCIVITDTPDSLSTYCQKGAENWLVLVPEQPHSELDHAWEEILSSALATGFKMETYFLANHSDGLGTTQLIHNLRPQHVMFVHGDPIYLADLTGLEELHNRYQLHSPAAGVLVEFPLGDKFIQPAIPLDTNYQGELNEFQGHVNFAFAETITSDPRWQKFSDTGLVEARWQGEELVVRGVSSKELLSQSNSDWLMVGVDCCAICRYQRGQRCWNQASPLYSFKVTPEGYCPVFEAIQGDSR